MKRIIFFVVLIFTGKLSFSQSNSNSVRQTFRDSIENKYLKNGAWHYLIFSHEWKENIDTALMLDPTNGYLWQQQSMPCFKCGKYELGMTYLDKAVEYTPSLIDYRAFIKCIFCKSYESALVDFEKAKSKNGQAYIMDRTYDFYMGLCYLQLNNFNKAEVLFKSSITFQTKGTDESGVSYLDWFYMGVTCYEKKNYVLAITYLDRAIKDYTHFSDAKYYKAKCCYYLGKKAEAKKLLAESASDLHIGYTINEGNTKYEKYPYQVEKESIEFEINNIQ